MSEVAVHSDYRGQERRHSSPTQRAAFVVEAAQRAATLKRRVSAAGGGLTAIALVGFFLQHQTKRLDALEERERMANYTNGQYVAKVSAMEEGQRTILRELRRLADRFDYAFGKAPRPRPEEPEEDERRN